MKSLLEGTPVRLLPPYDVSFHDIEKDETVIYSLLLSSGYLTVRSAGILGSDNKPVSLRHRCHCLPGQASKKAAQPS